MRALAEFIVRGRLQTGVVTVWGYLFPPIALAAVALVTLRKGSYEGTIALLLGLLPAVFLAAQEDAGLVIVVGALAFLMSIYIPALVLRVTVSLPLAILAVMVSSIVGAAFIGVFFSDALAIAADALSQRIADVQGGTSVQMTKMGLVGFIAYTLAFNAFAGLSIGRWLQAQAFNPGGFGREFTVLTLGAMPSLLLFIAAVGLFLQGSAYIGWASLMALPLLLVAIAVAHTVAKVRELPIVCLVMFYLAVIWFAQIVMCIGFADAWLNLRERFRKGNGH